MEEVGAVGEADARERQRVRERPVVLRLTAREEVGEDLTKRNGLLSLSSHRGPGLNRR